MADNLAPNWELIDRCRLWKVLGVTECENCPSLFACWGKNADLDYVTTNDD